MQSIGTLQEVKRRPSPPRTRDELEALFCATYGRNPHYKQLDWHERVWTALRPGIVHDGEQVLRSVPQLCRAMGLPYRNVRDARTRYGHQIRRTLDSLAEMGLLEGREPVLQASGAGRGILTRVPAGVAQSVGATPYVRRPAAPETRRQAARREAHEEPRSSSSRSLQPPSGEPAALRTELVSSKALTPSGVHGGACVRARPDRWQEVRDRARSTERARAALTIGKRLGSEVVDVVDRSPWMATAPVTSVARALMEQVIPGVAPLLSAKQQHRLEAAARRIDRYTPGEEPGRWIPVAIDMLEGGWRRYLSEPPRSLGALALCLRRYANAARFGELVARGGRLASTERGAEMARRHAVARQRFDRREHAHLNPRRPHGR